MAHDSSPDFHSVSDHLKHLGRVWMIWIFFVLRCADLGLIFFAWHGQNPAPLLRGVVVGSVLWNTVLIACVWQRRAWARYFLSAVIVLVIAAFALALMKVTNDLKRIDPRLLQAGIGGLVLYAACLVPLSRSRAILRLSMSLGGVQR